MKLGMAYYHDHSVIMQIRAAINALRIRSNAGACVFGFKHLLKNWSILGQLPNIEIPTLIIAGTVDFQFPPEHQMEMAKALRNAIYKGIDKAGHNTLIEKPAQTLEFIREFVQ